MVAIVTGNGLGLERASGLVLGSRGQLGSATFGRFGEQATINAATGNLLLGRTDEILIGQGPDSIVSRAYNSLGSSSGLGTNDNWQLNVQRLVTGLTGTVNTSGSTVTRVDWDGSNTVYTYDTGAGAYISKEGSGAYDKLTFASDVWTWTDGDTSRVESYDATNGGRITSSKDADNNTLTYGYTGSLLTSITTQYGDHTDLTWSGNNLTQISSTQGGATLTRTRYTYDGSDRLSTVITDLTPGDNSVTDGATVVTTYTYDGASSRVASISQTGGASLTISYTLVGADYRVSSLTQTMASGVTNVTSFSYDTTNRITTVTDGQGQVTKLTYDTGNQLVQLELPAAQSGASVQILTYAYNGNGDVISVTDAGGHATAYDYDSNGNVTLVRDAVGNTVTRTYDGANHLLTETRYFTPDPDGAGSGLPSQSATTRYTYDSAGHLRFVVSALGEVTEYAINGAGQITSLIAYRGNSYSLSGLGDGTAISLGALTAWLSAISDKSGVQRTDTTYDFRGNVATVTRYTQVDSSGNGLTSATYSRLTYTYDPYGNLLTRQTSGVANTEVFVYDGLGRLVSSTDLNGATTSVAFTDSLNRAVATMANGLVQTSIYNLAGDLISSAQSGTGITTGTAYYAYDNLGQLRMATDATGNQSYLLYDAVGRKVADIAADGSITEYRYDASDRLVSTISYASRLSGAQLSSLVSSGAPANVALSSVRPGSAADDAWTWRIYDDADRLIEAIGADGGVIAYSYDGLSNLVSTTVYATKLSAGALSGFMTTAPTSLQLPAADAAHDAVTRDFYDADGRLIGSLDANGYLIQIVYDSAGEKVETIAYANATAAADRATGSFATLLAGVSASSADEHTRYFYDSAGNLQYTLNSALRPTEYVYDAAGHLLHVISYGASIASAGAYTAAYVSGQITSLGLASHTDTRVGYSVYDDAGRLAYSISADGAVTGYVYDAVGQVVKTAAYVTLRATSSDPSLATMNSWVASYSAGADRINRAVYDQAGRLVYTVDAAGYVTENRYDLAGRVTQVIRYPSSYSVSDGATPASMASLLGSIPSTAVQISYAYDADGRVVDSYDGTGVRTHIVYDALGRISDRTVAYGLSTAVTSHFTYAGGRVLTETAAFGTPEASVTTYTYDGQGHVLSRKDGRDYTTNYTYDNRGHLKTATTPIDGSSSAVTTYYYDAFGNISRTTDPRGIDSYSFYDSLNRLTYQVDGEGYVTRTVYAIGNEIASVTRYATKVTGTITAGVLPAITTSAADATTTFTRDLLGRVTKVTDAEGHYEQYTLDAFGNSVQVRNKLGGITTNAFDKRGLLLSDTRAMNATRSDGTVQASSVTNTYQYDARGNRTQMVEAAGLSEQRTTSYTYDKMNRLLTTAGDAVTVIADDLVTTSSVTPTTTNIYDVRGNVIEIRDASGARTLYYYDHLDRQIASVTAAGTLSAFGYDLNGNLTFQRVYSDAVALPGTAGGAPPAPVNVNNRRDTVYAYDFANRLVTTTVSGVLYGYYNGSAFVTETGNLVITNNYDNAGNLISQRDANGGTVYYYYDKRGNRTAQVDQAKYLTYYTLDAEGNATKEERFQTAVGAADTSSDPATLRSGVAGHSADRITVFTYDRNGRRLTEQRQNVAAFAVNSVGTLTNVSGTATVMYAYNGLGEVTRKTEATGEFTNYEYDSFGRQTSVATAAFTDYTGSSVTPTTVMHYDGLNNLTRTVAGSSLVANPTYYITVNTYGAGGRLTSTTDANLFTTTYGYDAMGRTVKQEYVREKSNDSTVIEAKVARYDVMGRITSQSVATKNGGSWNFGDESRTQYNAFGEVTAKGTNDVWQEAISYDNAGRVWRATSGDGIAKIYYYDQNGNRTLEIASDGAALQAGYSWTSVNVINSNAGVVRTYKTYDARGQNTSQVEPGRQLTGALTPTTITKQHAYNAFGEVVRDTDAKGSQTDYAYNTMGRLVETIHAEVDITAENGATSKTRPLQTNYYDIAGRLVAIRDANGHFTKRSLLAGTGYDKTEGSITQEFHPDGGLKTNAYDQFGGLRKVADEIGNVTLMTYDAMGRLTVLERPTRAGASQALVEHYRYDGLGQRTQHWNNLYGSAYKDRTDYDLQGRVIQSVDMEGHVTTQSYTWSPTITTSLSGGGSIGTFGGWAQTTTNSAGLTSTITVDAFNRMVAKVDYGGNSFSYTFDLAGRLAKQTLTATAYLEYKYYNTGQLLSVSDIEVYYYTVTDPASVSDAGSDINNIYHPTDGHYEDQYIDGCWVPFWFETPAYWEREYDTNYNYYVTLTGTAGPVVEHVQGWTSHNYYKETTTAVVHAVTVTTDVKSRFEYDVNGNRTFEGMTKTVHTSDAQTTTTDILETRQDFSWHSDTGQTLNNGVPHAGVYYTQDPLTYYTYYTTDWVSELDTYTDNCYGQTIYVVPHTVTQQVADPATYYTYYTNDWVSDIYTYYDSCYCQAIYVVPHAGTYQEANAPTYYTYYTTDWVTDFYTYYDSTYGQAIYVVPHTGSYQAANPATYYTYYTNDWVSDLYTYYDSCYGQAIYVVPHAGTYQAANAPTYYTYYTNDWVSDLYTYYDSCYGQAIYVVPHAASYQAANPTTYYVYYYQQWVEFYDSYYDSCYNETYYYSLGYGEWVTQQATAPNAVTYYTVNYTYYSTEYSDPGTVGHYVTNAHTGTNATTYHTVNYTYYTTEYSDPGTVGHYVTNAHTGTNATTYYTAYYTYYTNEYTDPHTSGHYAVNAHTGTNPTTYHTVNYTYYSTEYSDPGTVGHYVTNAHTSTNPTTYHTVTYSYYAGEYSDPHTVGHYETNAHIVQDAVTYTAHNYTYYTNDPLNVNSVTYYDSGLVTTGTSHTTSTTVVSPADQVTVLQHETVTYDDMNRVVEINDTGFEQLAPINIKIAYDSNGNIVQRKTQYLALNEVGTPTTATTVEDWYKYDSMNRFVTTKGTLSGAPGSGAIVRGAKGVDITYDAAGNRATATLTAANGDVRTEIYAYTADGFLAKADVKVNGADPAKLAEYELDLMGRTTVYKEYSGSIVNPVYTRTAQYDRTSLVTHDETITVRSDGTYTSGTNYDYTAQSGTSAGVAAGAFMGGALVHSQTTNSNTVTGAGPTTNLTNDYYWRDSAQIVTSSYVSSESQVVHHDGYWENWDNSYSAVWHDAYDEVLGSAAPWVSNYEYDKQGHLKKVVIADGQPRTVDYVNNAMGQVMKRDVTYTTGIDSPHERHYYLAGMAIGDVTNNGTSNTDYVTQIAARTAQSQGYGPFRGGASTPTPHADFDQNYDPINGFDSQNAPANYVVKPGDTLQSIARQIWGDANLWYLIASANGLSAGVNLAVGSSIVIPNNQVHNFHNNTSTFKVYDPNFAIGDVSPTAPEIPPPPPPPAPPVQAQARRSGGGCGIFGQIIMAIVAVVVTVLTFNPVVGALTASLGSTGAAVVGGAIAGAAGSIVSQGVGVATGVQKSFNWGGVALAAIGGGVGGGLAASGVFNSSLGSVGGAIARGVVGSAVTQGIGVATGLQKNFDWAGVAAAGVGAGVMAAVSPLLPDAARRTSLPTPKGILVVDTPASTANIAVSGMAGSIVSAATRSLIDGSDFGDNIITGLPGIIGATIGNMIAPPKASATLIPREGYNPAAPTAEAQKPADNSGIAAATKPREMTPDEYIAAANNTNPVDFQQHSIQASDYDYDDISASVNLRIGAMPGGNVNLVKTALEQLPLDVLRYVRDEGMSFVAVKNSVVEYVPGLSGFLTGGSETRFWNDTGGTYIYATNAVVVATAAQSPSRYSVTADIVLHELGHAIDYRLGIKAGRTDISGAKVFADTHAEANQKRPWNPKNLNDSYYLPQGNPQYLSETFAESFASHFTQGEGGFGNNNPDFLTGRQSLVNYWQKFRW